jgi:hypothetical protein
MRSQSIGEVMENEDVLLGIQRHVGKMDLLNIRGLFIFPLYIIYIIMFNFPRLATNILQSKQTIETSCIKSECCVSSLLIQCIICIQFQLYSGLCMIGVTETASRY